MHGIQSTYRPLNTLGQVHFGVASKANKLLKASQPMEQAPEMFLHTSLSDADKQTVADHYLPFRESYLAELDVAGRKDDTKLIVMKQKNGILQVRYAVKFPDGTVRSDVPLNRKDFKQVLIDAMIFSSQATSSSHGYRDSKRIFSLYEQWLGYDPLGSAWDSFRGD